MFDISFITFFGVHFALKTLTHFESIYIQSLIKFLLLSNSRQELVLNIPFQHSYSVLIHCKCHLLVQAYLAFAQSRFSTCTCTLVANLNFVALFCLIRCTGLRYAVPVQNTLCLFEILCVWSRYALPGSQYAVPFRGMRCLFPLW